MASTKHNTARCQWSTGEIIHYQYEDGKQNMINLTYCKNPDNFGYPFAQMVPADSCCPYPCKLNDWNNKPSNRDKPLPAGCRFFEPVPAGTRRKSNNSEDESEAAYS